VETNDSALWENYGRWRRGCELGKIPRAEMADKSDRGNEGTDLTIKD
jgi:hypothetical protein